MRNLILLVLFVSTKLSASVNGDLTRIYQLMQTDRKSAKELILELKSTNDILNDELWMVRSNFYLAYIHKLDGEYGKSVIYYLEAIRNSENATFEGIQAERISLHKNISNIFHQFKAHDLGVRYNSKALELANLSHDTAQIISIKFNQAVNFRITKEFDKAIDLFLEVYSLSPEEKIMNEVGLSYMLKEDWNNAKFYFQKLTEKEISTPIYKAKALHNLGEIEYKNGNIKEAIHKLTSAISIKESLNKSDKRSLFISYKTIGEYLLSTNSFDKAGVYLLKSEDLASQINMSLEHYNIYELLSEYNYSLGNAEMSQHYSNLYSDKLKSHIDTQEEIQETDKRYNMDLITKRYFDEVEKQEKIASILFYSRLTSGGLLALLLFVIGYNRYEKLRVRRSIEKQLIHLEMME